MNGTVENCGNCRFWLKDQSGTWCRRFPPTPYVVPDQIMGARIIGNFAPSPANYWCGEWREDRPGGGVVSAVPLVRTNQVGEPTPDHAA